MNIHHTDLDLSQSFVRDYGARFVVRHGTDRLRDMELSAARQSGQAAWVRARLREQGIDVSEFSDFQSSQDNNITRVYFGR